MITIHSRKTTASLKRVVEDTGINLRRASKREAVVSLAQTWNLAHEARKRQEEAANAEAARIGLVEHIKMGKLSVQRRAALREMIQMVRERTKRLVPNPDDFKRSVHWIINDVATENGVLVTDILGRKRTGFIVAVRHQAMTRAWLSHRHLPLGALARPFKVNHTTFLHAIQKSGHWQPRQKSDRP